MARTLHLLVCISAAMTASGGYKYPYSFQSWNPPYNFEDSETMDYPAHDSMIVRPDRSNAKMIMYEPPAGSFKIVNRGPKPVPLYQRRAGSAEDRVLFPGPTSRNGASDQTQKIPEDCQKYKLCDNVPDYPADEADKIIAKLGDKIKYLAMDELEPTPEITQRLGGFEDQELCAFQTMIKYPEGGFDKNDTYHKILNNKKNPIQGVRVEICDETDKPCKGLLCTMPGYISFCTQKYSYRPMLIIEGNKELEVQIAVPSCCACMVRQTSTF